MIGGGIMGAGIAQAAAMNGYAVSIADMKAEQLQRAEAAISESLRRLVAKGRVTNEAAQTARAAVTYAESVDDGATDADVVVEAVVELLAVKQDVLARAALVAKPDALLATNTSQLSITSIGSGLGPAADRFVGLHFFNPVVLMRLVEVIKGLETAESTLKRAVEFASSLGKETVVCQRDSPGFLTSRISAIVRLECLRMLEEGVGTAEDIDRALRLGLNFPIGPLELGDRNGLDTYLLVLESLASTLGERFRPTVGLRNLVAAGRLGQKTGRGIYDYRADGSIEGC